MVCCFCVSCPLQACMSCRSHRLHSYRGYAMAPKSLKRLYSLEHIPDTYCRDSGTAPEAHSQERSMSPGGSVVDLTMSE